MQAKLELGVGNDDALGGRNVARGFVELDADVADAGGQVDADHGHGLFEGDVFVVLAHRRFGRWRVNGLGQAAGVFQACGQLHTAHSLVILVLLPATARQITAHHRLNRDGFEALDQHGAALDLRYFCGAHHALGRFACQVNGANVQAFGAELVKPKQRHLREQHPFARDRLAHDHVKSTDAVRSHHQDAVVTHGVVVTHLASRQQGQGGQSRGVECRGHGETVKQQQKRKRPVEQTTGHSGQLSQAQFTTWANSPRA
ncbi:unannotated protein [freshwater metagenome]|uniref:Unannotated protein n=1 Tax=freshwater metagenome TaxID=449393 RepID=A0A6J6EQ84_9ZZZZ